MSHNASENTDTANDTVSDVEADNRTFTLFLGLPTELRFEIWQYAIPAGRVVDIVYDKEQDRYFSFHTKVPTVLHVCRESRQVALEVYDICFGTKTHFAAIPFDFERDCMMLDDWLAGCYREGRMSGLYTETEFSEELARLIGPLGSEEFDMIEKIAIPEDFKMAVIHEAGLELAGEFLALRFSAMDTLFFCIEDHREPYARGPITFLPSTLKRAHVWDTIEVKEVIEEVDEALDINRGEVQIHFRHVCRAGVSMLSRSYAEHMTALQNSFFHGNESSEAAFLETSVVHFSSRPYDHSTVHPNHVLPRRQDDSDASDTEDEYEDWLLEYECVEDIESNEVAALLVDGIMFLQNDEHLPLKPEDGNLGEAEKEVEKEELELLQTMFKATLAESDRVAVATYLYSREN